MYRKRYRKITSFFGRNLISLAIFDILYPRIGFRKYSEETRPQRLGKFAKSFRELAIEMGGVLIKVGQFLSTRVDVMPPEFTDELIGLQDEVPPIKFESIKQVAEDEFGESLDDRFVAFDATPLAAASLGQVHRAKMYKTKQINQEEGANGNQKTHLFQTNFDEIISVVVKIQRPDMEAIIDTDLEALRTVGGWLNHYQPIRRRVNIKALLEEFTRTLYEEIDYIAEGNNAEHFAQNFRNVPQVRVPNVIWSHTTKKVLTLENVWGIKITEYEGITNSGVSRSDVANLLIDTYLKQIFDDGFFHADPHPGNLFVNPIPIMPPITGGTIIRPQQSEVFWQLTFVDFGMIGRIPDNMKAGLRELLIGIATNDIPRVIKSYEMLDILLPGADIQQLEQAGSEIFELFWGKNMTELNQIDTDEVIQVTKEYRQLVYTLPIQIPQNIIFLGRTVGILSGICTGLDPQFNLFDHLAPYAQQLIIEQAKVEPARILSGLGLTFKTLYSLPRRVDSAIAKMEKGDISVKIPEVSKQISQLDKAIRQVAFSIVFASLLVVAAQLYLADEDTMAIVVFISALVSIIASFWISRRR